MPLARDSHGQIVQAPDWSTASTVAITSTSTQSATVADNTTHLRIVSTVDCYVALGSNPTATSSSSYLPAGVVEYVAVVPSVTKVAVIRTAADGVLSLTACA